MALLTLIDTSNVPADLIISNNTENDVNLPIYPDNGTLLLKPGQQIIYKVATSREYLFYYQTCKSLGLSLSEQE